MKQMLERAAGTSASPGTYGTVVCPSAAGGAVRSVMRFLRCRAWDQGSRSHSARLDAPMQAGDAGLAPPPGCQALDAPDRRGIVFQKAGRNEPRHKHDPAVVAGEHFPENRRRFLFPSELPERCGLPEEDLVVPRGETRSLRVGLHRVLDLPLGRVHVALV